MGIAALVLGIVSLVIAFVPFCGMIALLPAIIGLVIGIIDLVIKNRTNKGKAPSIAGVVTSSIAIIIMIFWLIVIGFAISSGDIQEELKNLGDEIQLEIDNDITNSL